MFGLTPKFFSIKVLNSDAESDVEGVSETYFGEQEDNLGVVNSGLDKSIPYPPGFTPEKDNKKTEEQEVKNMDSVKSQSRSEGICSCILEDAQPIDEHQSSEIPVNGREQKKSGSILEVLDDMIKVDQTIGFSMEGCMKDMENIIGFTRSS
ncbi:hypothetical protein Tco_1395116 [Tanacetum coccineum]